MTQALLAALFDSFGLARLVPASHAAYRPLLVDGLVFFLGRLPPERLDAIVARQLALPASAGAARRIIALFRQCPTLHKLGQVVARDARLAPGFRRRLQELESGPPSTDWTALQTTIRQELGVVPGLNVARRALAEASVAVIVPFDWKESPHGEARRGVFKILRPGVAERLHEELEIFADLARFLAERACHYRLPEFDIRGVLDSVGRLLAHEVRLDREQENLRAAARFHAGSPDVRIPALLPFSTDRITAMERIDGVKVTAAGLNSAGRHRLADILIEAMVAKPMWARGESAVAFHADPHAGNLHRTPDGRLAIFDWALVARIGKAEREAAIAVFVAALTLDRESLLAGLSRLGRIGDRARTELAAEAALARVARGDFPGLNWLTELLDELSNSGAVRFPEAIILFRKALLTLSAVVAEVSPTPSIDAVVMRAGWLDFLAGLAWRPFAAFDARACGAHLSNADLFRICAGLPATTGRFLDRSAHAVVRR